jgi:hypothetical protein
MRRLTVTALSASFALIWLVLLAATAFNAVTVSLGLLGALVLLPRG